MNRPYSALKMGVAAAALLAATSFGAMAQNASADMSAQIRAQKELVAANPDNVRALFDLAMLQKQAGYRGDAIKTLEQVRAMRPDLPRVDLELAMLHYAVGDYAEAKPYFANARASSEASPKLREQIDLYVSDIDRRLSPSSTHGNVVVGLSYQTNANGGTDDLGSLVNTLNPADVEEESDGNVFVSAGLTHIQNIATGGRITWDTSLRGYGSAQFQVDEVNAMLAAVNTGFTFNFGKERMNAVTLRPYVKADYLFLGEATYHNSGSIGVAGGFRPNETLALGLGYEFTIHNYHDDEDLDAPVVPPATSGANRPNAKERKGNEHQIHGTVAVAFTKQDSVTLRGVGSLVDADTDWWSYDQFEVSLRYAHRFSALVFPGELAGNVSAGVSYATAEYDAGNPALAPNLNARDEDRWKVDANATVPFDKNIGMLVGVGYTIQESNVELYDYDNLQATVGAAISF